MLVLGTGLRPRTGGQVDDTTTRGETTGRAWRMLVLLSLASTAACDGDPMTSPDGGAEEDAGSTEPVVCEVPDPIVGGTTESDALADATEGVLELDAWRPYYLLSTFPFARLFRGTDTGRFKRSLARSHRVDRTLFATLPFLRRWAWRGVARYRRLDDA